MLESLLTGPFVWYLFPTLLLLLLLTIFGFLLYSGLFANVEVSAKEPVYGPLIVAYKTGKGPYKNAGELFTIVHCLVPHRQCIGIYYDDPEAVAPEEQRYIVGAILANGQGKTAEPAEMENMMQEGFKIIHLPRPNHAVLADFPFRTTLSIYLAIFRVYPKLKEYISSRGLCAYPAVEVYTEDTIHFMMPLSRQDEFFVSEFSEEEISIATTEMSTESRVRTNFQEKADEKVELQPSISLPRETPDAGSDNPKRRLSEMRRVSSEEKSDSNNSEFEDLSQEVRQTQD